MGEVVHVQLGKYGNVIGDKFWEVISREHKLDSSGRYKSNTDIGLQRINVFFMETADNRYVPRAICVSEQQPMLSKPFGKLFKEDNIVISNSSVGNSWHNGFKQTGVVNSILELLRKEIEICDMLQAIQIVHALSDGIGSGTGSLLIKKIRDQYPRKILISYIMIPSYETKEICNSVLSIEYLSTYASGVFYMDEEALQRIYNETWRIPGPKTDNIYDLVSACMAGITACMRFPGELNIDYRKLLMNLVPYRDLQFFVPGYVPLRKQSDVSLPELTRQMFDYKSMFATIPPSSSGRYITATVIFRGNMPIMHVDREIFKIQAIKSSDFISWIPNHVQFAISDRSPPGMNMCATWVSNTTAIEHPLRRLHDSCNPEKNPQILPFIQEDVDMMNTALKHLNFLIYCYRQAYENNIKTNNNNNKKNETQENKKENKEISLPKKE